MQIDGAVIRERGQTFAVVVVKKHVVQHANEARAAIRSFGPVFPGMPVLLMAQDARGQATYYGRPDIARFLAGISPSRIPWRRYNVN